ncbi:FabD/lysophospholipase-like protein [Xylona heveae TC161]|uniref:Lysophospholipase n=1 Tax=Xylona heveae (strain CBS 132557 / TC161) TaxID=1328760 RepID=A0A161TCA8_XYLHT|nr:FabD/lysophospholipase-like protein [Xylona heveae TC161]KZF23407.1 FabD/lysophospholipase-like protein [Xylona heveae TC161]
MHYIHQFPRHTFRLSRNAPRPYKLTTLAPAGTRSFAVFRPSRRRKILRPFIFTLIAGGTLIPLVALNLPPLHNESSSSGRPSHTRDLVSEHARKESVTDREHAIQRKERDIVIATSQESYAGKGGQELQSESQLESADTSAWGVFSAKVASVKTSVASVDWGSVGNSVANFIVPDWAKILSGYILKLQQELSMSDGSLAFEIWEEAHDPSINPEILWKSSVRVSGELCDEETDYLVARGKHTKKALAKYLDLPENDIHPDDVPRIAICGSGGGLRALVAGTGSFLSAQDSGLFDCVTYTAGVSGSCWLQTLYFSSLGKRDHAKLINHLKARLGVHIAFPPAALDLLTSAPTNKFLLTGLIEKLRSNPEADFGLVDIYGLLLAARLLVPRGELDVQSGDLKISNQRGFLSDGANPMPIYSAVRHEIPIEEEIDKGREDHVSTESSREQAREIAKRESWFQWFEFTPYELWCEELGAGIPTWAIGRRYRNGEEIPRETGTAIPEIKVPQLMGIWGSAFCASLAHYYKEIRPVVAGLAGFGGIDQLIEGRNEDLIKVHPIDPAMIPNYGLGMKMQLPSTCPESIFTSDYLQLMDAGMSNNLPIYPLLRPGRNVDIIIAFDASADIKTDNWLSEVDGYARQRGIKGWPLGTGWPKSGAKPSLTVEELEAAQSVSAEEASKRVAEEREKHGGGGTPDSSVAKQEKAESELGYCTVWVGTTEERQFPEEPPPSKRVEEDWELMKPDAGIAVIYFPLLPNEKVPGVDPQLSDFMSTWNFIYTPEQVDKVVSLARANYEEGQEQTKRTIRAIYERKKAKRLERERIEEMRRFQERVRAGYTASEGNSDHGDHFS